MITTVEASPISTSVSKELVKSQWLAHLLLEFSNTSVGTQLTRTQRKGPLSVQKAFYPEGRDCAHIYLLHPPAGIVSGDELRISVAVNTEAHLLFTTPGAGRFYRARTNLDIGESKQVQITKLALEAKAICENFPQETIVYEGADGFNSVDIELTSSSIYLGWDITCLGLPDSGEPFKEGKFCQLNRLYCDDKLIYHDRIALSSSNNLLTHPAGLANKSVFATFLAYAPERLVAASQRSDLVNQLREVVLTQAMEKNISITDIDGLLVIRYLGAHAHECKRIFINLWEVLRPLLVDKKALQPRIWHT